MLLNTQNYRTVWNVQPEAEPRGKTITLLTLELDEH